MIAGARQGRGTRWHRLAAAAMARDLRVLIVPGPEVARAAGLDLHGAGLRLAATPRDANVLVLTGALPPRIRQAAAVVYAQMVRPRAILALGVRDVTPLPAPDEAADLSQPDLVAAVARLRSLLAQGAFAPAVRSFDVDVLHAAVEYVCPMHPEVVQDQPGQCPKCGMELAARDHHSRHSSHDASARRREAHEEAKQSVGHDAHGGHSHGAHEHGGMSFMSMVEVTKDLPRSRDGLAMEWIEVPFGPFFPGLPGGLRLTLTLDGDGVARGHADCLTRMAVPTEDIEADAFIERLAAAAPVASMAYRLLGCRAVEQAAGRTVDAATGRMRLAALERERIASHLSWMSQLGRQIGFDWLARRAATLQLGARQADTKQLLALRPAVQALGRRLERTPWLKARLAGIGRLAPDTGLRGPVARASGIAEDARLADEVYDALGFEIVLREQGDALDRLRVRLSEIIGSLQLIEATRIFGAMAAPVAAPVGATSGAAQAVVETPRGRAELHLTLEQGRVRDATLDTACARHWRLIPGLVEQQELGDALLAVGSLDLSPWEAGA